MIIEKIITSFIVSIDGFFLGLVLGINKTKLKIRDLIKICIIPIIMAFPIMIIGNKFRSIINSDLTNIISFFIFIVLAINSIKQDNHNLNAFSNILIGFSIGIDSSVSAFSLALNNHNPYSTPFYFGIFHFILLLIGNRLSINNIKIKIDKLKYISPFLFIIIGLSKLI